MGYEKDYHKAEWNFKRNYHFEIVKSALAGGFGTTAVDGLQALEWIKRHLDERIAFNDTHKEGSVRDARRIQQLENDLTDILTHTAERLLSLEISSWDESEEGNSLLYIKDTAETALQKD